MPKSGGDKQNDKNSEHNHSDFSPRNYLHILYHSLRLDKVLWNYPSRSRRSCIQNAVSICRKIAPRYSHWKRQLDASKTLITASLQIIKHCISILIMHFEDRLSREMSQTDHILPRYIQSRVRVSVRPRILYTRKKRKPQSPGRDRRPAHRSRSQHCGR